MKEQDLIDLGFAKESEEDYYYYVLEFGGGFELISNCNNELVDGKWFAEVFEENSIRFTNIEDLTEFINIINRNRR
jgi:hypothetical protein